jgi:hypothetical protein
MIDAMITNTLREERAAELIRLSNSETGMSAVHLEYIRCHASQERNLQQLLGPSVTQMIEAILKREFPLSDDPSSKP